MQRAQPEESAFIVIDVQEKLVPTMPEPRMQALERAVKISATTARVLGVPGWVTEQYPRGLGPTHPAVLSPCADAGCPVLAKTAFSIVGAPGLLDELQARSTRTVFLLGMEAHICVFQSARDLCAAGLAVHVVMDGVCSRHDDHRQTGLDLCRRAGALITTAETLAFDLLGDSSHAGFREISRSVR